MLLSFILLYVFVFLAHCHLWHPLFIIFLLFLCIALFFSSTCSLSSSTALSLVHFHWPCTLCLHSTLSALLVSGSSQFTASGNVGRRQLKHHFEEQQRHKMDRSLHIQRLTHVVFYKGLHNSTCTSQSQERRELLQTRHTDEIILQL